MGKLIDETNKQYGRLHVIRRAPNDMLTDKQIKRGQAYWVCKCNCGNTIVVKGSHLREGSIQSCGCLQKENVSKAKTEDITGQTFGYLTVIRKAYNNELNDFQKKSSYVCWYCYCNNCGNYTIAYGKNLRNGDTISCGCKHNSIQYENIKNLLSNNNIQFINKYNLCINPKTNHYLKVDFFVEQKYIIEYDGIQHYIAQNYFKGEKGLEDTKYRDNIKNEYCKIHNIPLIRIPYTVEEIKLEDLLLETSKYIID